MVQEAKIEKAWMNGERRSVFVATGVVWPNGLSLDLEHNQVYWTDGYTNKIERIGFSGRDRKVCCKKKFLFKVIFFLYDLIYVFHLSICINAKYLSGYVTLLSIFFLITSVRCILRNTVFYNTIEHVQHEAYFPNTLV